MTKQVESPQHPMRSEVTKLEKETFGERSGFIVPRQGI
jgi:hypothetical protein